MNKYEKKIVKSTKGIIENSEPDSEFAKFRFARKYVRILISGDKDQCAAFNKRYIESFKRSK